MISPDAADPPRGRWSERPRVAFWYARRPFAILVWTVSLSAGCVLLVNQIAEVRISPDRPVRFMNMAELLPFTMLVVILFATSSRTSPWEMFGTRNYQRMFRVCNLVCLALPMAMLAIAIAALPSEAPAENWRWIVVNLAAWTALGLILLAYLGPISTTFTLVLAFVAVAAAQQTLGPELTWMPFASPFDPGPRYWTLIALPLAIWVRQRRAGSATLDDSLWRNLT